MQVYPNVFAYLNTLHGQKLIHSPSLEISMPLLVSRDRPILVFQESENLHSHPLLLQRGTQDIYELGMPNFQITCVEEKLGCPAKCISLSVADRPWTAWMIGEIIDEGAIETEEQRKEMLNQWGERLDQRVADLIQILVGSIGQERSQSNSSKAQTKIRVIDLVDHLSKFDIKDAVLPLPVSLEQHYHLSCKITQIKSKLRHQLRRQSELLPVGRIQEMDSYCLRDYVRRPGRSAVEKAGARQMLMGVQRYQDFNTYENRFLLYFLRQLRMECIRYNEQRAYQHQIRIIRQRIDSFQQEPLVQAIFTKNFHVRSPNYILQKNPIYNSFYKAYLDYSKKRTLKERIWSFCGQLLSDVIQLCFWGTFLQIQGAYVSPLAHLKTRISPDQGNYLIACQFIQPVQVFLQDKVYEFRIEKQDDLANGDFYVNIRIHNLKTSELTLETKQIPCWVFWYKPNDEVINQAVHYLHHLKCIGFVFFLQNPPESDIEPEASYCVSSHLWICHLRDLTTCENLRDWTGQLADLLLSVLEL